MLQLNKIGFLNTLFNIKSMTKRCMHVEIPSNVDTYYSWTSFDQIFGKYFTLVWGVGRRHFLLWTNTQSSATFWAKKFDGSKFSDLRLDVGKAVLYRAWFEEWFLTHWHYVTNCKRYDSKQITLWNTSQIIFARKKER